MKNLFKILAVALVVLCPMQSNAQSLSDLLGGLSSKSESGSSAAGDAITSLVDMLTDGEELSNQNLTGEWVYSSPAVVLESEDMLASAAATALTSQVETLVADQLVKIGIVAGKFKFNLGENYEFSYSIKERPISGKYIVNGEEKTVSFKTQALNQYNIASMTAYCIVSGDKLQVLFEANKLLEVATKVTDSSTSSTISTIRSILKAFDNAYIGLEFNRTPGTGMEKSTGSSTTDKVSGALKGLFGR